LEIWKLGLGFYQYGVERETEIEIGTSLSCKAGETNEIIFRTGSNFANINITEWTITLYFTFINPDGERITYSVSFSYPDTSASKSFLPQYSSFTIDKIVIKAKSAITTTQQLVPVSDTDTEDILHIEVISGGETQAEVRIDGRVSHNVASGDISKTISLSGSVGDSITEDIATVTFDLPSKSITATIQYTYTEGSPNMFQLPDATGNGVRLIVKDQTGATIIQLDMTNTSGESSAFTIPKGTTTLTYTISCKILQAGIAKIQIITIPEHTYS